MAVQEQNTEIVVKRGFNPKFYEIERPGLSNGLNAKKIKVLVSYISHLYAEGEISDKAFKSIISHAYSTYLEGTINLRVKTIELKLQEMLEQYFSE